FSLFSFLFYFLCRFDFDVILKINYVYNQNAFIKITSFKMKKVVIVFSDFFYSTLSGEYHLNFMRHSDYLFNK
ncbi:hypothetical protein D5081_21305, partial [Pectobacterium carotovorum]